MKIHLKDKTTPESKYPNSPHLKKAIRNGWWSRCKFIAEDCTTEDIKKVTCMGCKKIEETRQEILFRKFKLK